MSAKVKDTKMDTVEKDFLGELKIQFEKDQDLRKTLDSKATSMITVASSIATLNIAIGTFLISQIVDKDPNHLFYYIPITILIAGVCLAVLSIWRFIQSYSIRTYTYPVGHDHFFEKDIYIKETVETIRNLSEKEFNDMLFKGYLESIKKSAELNKDKASGIKTGQKMLPIH